MDRQRFDALVRAAATSTSRRQLLKALAVGLTGGLFARTGPTRSAQEGCAPGLTDCGGVCVDTLSDAKHCGFCDNVCPSGQCAGGSCLPAGCPPGQTDCGGFCADLLNDPKHCGFCGNVCPSGACSGGACVPVGCPPGQTDCGGYCDDLFNDATNCGRCGVICESGLCSGGGCVPVGCPAGTLDCGGGCVDPATDPKHCGSCGNACPSGVCAGGACAEPEPTKPPTPEPTATPEPPPPPNVPAPDNPTRRPSFCFERITVWINAFVPREVPGITTPVLFGPFAGNETMVNGLPSGRCWLTNGRTFDADIAASSVAQARATVDVSGGDSAVLRVEGERAWRLATSEIDCRTGAQLCLEDPSGPLAIGGSRARIVGPGTVEIPVEAALDQGCVATGAARGATSVDFAGAFYVSVAPDGRSATVAFHGEVGLFPAYEVYATATTHGGETYAATLLNAAAGRGYGDVSTGVSAFARRAVSTRRTLYCGCGRGRIIEPTSGACQCPPGQEARGIADYCACPEPLEWDDFAEQCVCPRDEDPETGVCPCPNGQIYDLRTQRCACPGNQEFVEALGRCACRERCPAAQIQDAETCECRCPLGRTWNGAEFECECGITTCPAGSTLHPELCVCVREDLNAECQAGEAARCSCPGDMVYDEARRSCRCRNWYQVFDFAAGRCACHPNLVPGPGPGQCQCAGGQTLYRTPEGLPGCRCTGGQNWNNSALRCECPGLQSLSALTHVCECPLPAPQCPPPKVYNARTCLCECPSRECGQNARVDERTCECICLPCTANLTRTGPGCQCSCQPNLVRCPVGYVAIQNANCDCVPCRPELVSCPAGQTVDRTTCRCQACPPQSCPSGQTFNTGTCRCETPATTCPAGQMLCGDICVWSSGTCCPRGTRDLCPRTDWPYCCRVGPNDLPRSSDWLEICVPVPCGSRPSCSLNVHYCPVGTHCFGSGCCPNGFTCTCASHGAQC